MENDKRAVDRDPVEKVLAEFDAKKEKLDEFCTRTKSLIEDCLEDAQLRVQSVQARVKRSAKLRQKYLDPSKDYTCLNDITDQAALRVIVYYEDEIDRAAEVIMKEFHVLPQFTVDKRETEPDRFGYYALNCVCTYAERRKSDVQFKRYADLRFEIQITSVLSHAWSEIEHEWYDLKDAYPREVKRRFARLAALLQIAESEFLSLRNQKNSYKRSVEVQVEADIRNIAIDPVSLSKFILVEPEVQTLDRRIAALLRKEVGARAGVTLTGFWAACAKEAGLENLDELRTSLWKYGGTLCEYVELCIPHWGPITTDPVTPGTCIYQLSIMLMAARGEATFQEALDRLGSNPPPRLIPKQAEIAAEVMLKYGSE